jgi:predicted secreted acid phosphatase
MPFDPVSFNNWAVSGKSVALPAILGLYKHLNTSGYQIFFLTGRDESQRNITHENLVSQGYTVYAGLILRYIYFLVSHFDS